MDFFQTSNYREILLLRLKEGNQGRGRLAALSKHLNVHSTLVSQIMSGLKNFTIDQAILVTDFLSLTSTEASYFVGLVELERAGHNTSKRFFQNKLEAIRNQVQSVSERVGKFERLNDELMATYYSDWKYMAVWLATSLEPTPSLQEIALKLKIANSQAEKIADFLVTCGLVLRDGTKYVSSINKTHLPDNHNLIGRHHANWRLKAIERADNISSDELMFTGPLTISLEDFAILKKDLLSLIENASKRISKSKCEIMGCLNIDLFKIDNWNL
ncbi:MAG: DUF4423 domain-containing protein [Proteobacteria bacterium]|nr:DUF4423 domain-containing protein [Pseudomonadota bacterium]